MGVQDPISKSCAGQLAAQGDGTAHRHGIAVLIPCLNEEVTIGKVVRDFALALPGAVIYVFDNASSDRTVEVARNAGARVIHSPQRGKGNVIRHMKRAVDADIFVLVDGDGTYPASAAPELIDRFRKERLDMLVATRLEQHHAGAFRLFHRFGNRFISWLVSVLFSVRVGDVLSGYRILSRQFFRMVPLQARGFEIETELTLQAAGKSFGIREVPVEYGARPENSHSKLNTVGDGFIILRCLVLIFKDYKPLLFFSVIAGILALASLAAGIGPVLEFYETGIVLRVPRAILAAGLGILATLSFSVGLILDTVAKYHNETMELWRQHLH